MPQKKANVGRYDFTGGLNTESSPLNYVPNQLLDVRNLELMEDGSVRRRRRLDIESTNTDGNSFGTMSDSSSDSNATTNPAYSWTRWSTAGDGKQYIVIQAGGDLNFYEDSSTALADNLIETLSIRWAGISNDFTSLGEQAVTWGEGDGRLFLTSKFMNTVEIKIDDSTGLPTFNSVVWPEIREYRDVQDGVAMDVLPSTLTNAHSYNLRIRGFSATDITNYKGLPANVYPSKALPWWRGWQGDSSITTSATAREADWTRQWVAEKIVAAEFGDSSAPRGRQKVQLYSQTSIDGDPTNITALSIISPAVSAPGTTTWRLRLTTDATHGAIVNDVVRIKNLFFQTFQGINPYWHSLEGRFVVKAVPSTTQIEVDYLSSTTEWDSKTDLRLGTAVFDEFDRPSGFDTEIATGNRPRACEFFAGRLFLAGVDHPNLADKIYFSQTITRDEDVRSMHQEGDPTTDTSNQLVPTDGGYFQIPGIGRVFDMRAYDQNLFVFANNGVWMVRGGEGYFAADDIFVSQVSEVGAVGTLGIVKTEFGFIYTSNEGVIRLHLDPTQGDFRAENIIEQSIQTLWNNLSQAQRNNTQAEYDESRKVLYFGYPSDSTYTNTRNNWLTYDVRRQSWFRWDFDDPVDRDFYFGSSGEYGYIAGVAITETSDEAANNAKLKFTLLTTSDTRSPTTRLGWTYVHTFDLNQADDGNFADYHSNSTKATYMELAYDNLGTWEYRRQAPFIHVFMRQTETGYTDVDPPNEDLQPINTSSVLMAARWDWADNQNANKWGSQQQVYRHPRVYIPQDSTDTFETGTPVLVTKNKVRGRGRSLHLRFDAEDSKDFHLYGYAVQYAGEENL